MSYHGTLTNNFDPLLLCFNSAELQISDHRESYRLTKKGKLKDPYGSWYRFSGVMEVCGDLLNDSKTYLQYELTFVGGRITSWKETST